MKETLFKIAKIVKRFFLKFCDLSGAKDCKSCRSRKMLQNAPTLAIVAVHAAENEILKMWGDLFISFNPLLNSRTRSFFFAAPNA